MLVIVHFINLSNQLLIWFKSINLPYIKGTTNNIAKIPKKGNIKVSFSPPNTTNNLLDHAKDTINPKNKKRCIFNTLFLWKTIHWDKPRDQSK
jgi:hypothetical protein